MFCLNKLCIGSGGAGKDRAVAAKCFEEKRDEDGGSNPFKENIDHSPYQIKRTGFTKPMMLVHIFSPKTSGKYIAI